MKKSAGVVVTSADFFCLRHYPSHTFTAKPPLKKYVFVQCPFGGAEPLPILEAWGHIADESDPSSKLEEGIEQTNLRKLPLCQVIVKNPLGQLWLVGKDVLQGPRNGR